LLIDVYTRYTKFHGQVREELIQILLNLDRVEDVLPIYYELILIDNYTSKAGKTKQALELEMCQIIAKFPNKCYKLKQSPIVIVRQLIEKHKQSEVSSFWICLSEFFIRQGDFDLAREIFEEALDIENQGSIQTVRDFSIVFNAYL
jgi:pre-mRNA-splicing factor SYF1